MSSKLVAIGGYGRGANMSAGRVTITGCNGCPLLVDADWPSPAFCNHPENYFGGEVFLGAPFDRAPYDCPLRGGTLFVLGKKQR